MGHLPLGDFDARAGQFFRDILGDSSGDEGLLGSAHVRGEVGASLSVEFGEDVIENQDR
jgi:hypothetical protein